MQNPQSPISHLTPATSLDEVYQTLKPDPLTTKAELTAFYQSEMNEVRGDMVQRMQLQLDRSHNIGYFKAFFMGHQGIGKSTELSRLTERVQWWMTPALMQVAIHAMPDLNSWFAPRLQLTEAINPNQSIEIEPALEFAPASYANMADTHRRVDNLLQRFHQAQAAHLPDDELLANYLLPALESLAEVGAQQELRDLTLQFEGLLGRLKVDDSPDLAISLNRLARLYYDQGRYSDAEPLFVCALAISEQRLGANHLDTATSLNNLAELYYSIGRYSDAEPLFVRALAIREHQLGVNHPDTAGSLNNLALLYRSIGRYGDAEPLLVRAISISEQQLGEDHPNTQAGKRNLEHLRSHLNNSSNDLDILT